MLLRCKANVSRIRTTRLLAIWLLFSFSLQAQQYVFRAYRQPEGLKNLAVTGLATGSGGFLWLATENGVYRFLGAGFEHYGPEQGIAELNVTNIVAGPSGEIWAGTEQNLYFLHGNSFSPAGKEPIPVGGYRLLANEDASHLLLVSKGRLYRLEHDAEGRVLSYTPAFSDGVLKSIPELGQIFSLSMVSERTGVRTLWIGCGTKLFSLPADRIDKHIIPGDDSITEWGQDRGLPKERWLAVLLDREGTLWAGGQSHIMALASGARRFVDHSVPGSDPQGYWGNAPMIEDAQGRILVPAAGGIARWNGSSWQLIGLASGMERTTQVTSMVFDATGDLWFGCRGDGLQNWVGYANWEAWADRQRLPSSIVWAIRPLANGHTLIGTARGPAWIDLRTGLVTALSSNRGWTYGQVNAIGIDREDLFWTGTSSGAILVVDPKTASVRQTAKLPAAIIGAFEDSDGRLYFITTQGIFAGKTRGAKAAPQRIPDADALLGSSNEVSAVCKSPDGAAWFLSNNRLVRLDRGLWAAPPIAGLPKLQGQLIALSCAADGALWATGQQTGTWRFQFSDGRVQAWPLALPPDLRSIAPLAILADRRGWVWLGTDLGLAVWNGRSWRHLTQESGLIWNDVSEDILRDSPDGSIWIGTAGGVAHLLHPELVFDASPLPASVTSVRRGEQDLTAVEKIVLPWAGLPLRFQVSSPVARDRSELVFKYRLDGLQTDWIESQDGVAVYSRLLPGTYAFTAIASNPGLGADSAPLKVQVIILPPWWRTNSFYFLCALALMLVVVAADRLRAKYLGAKSRELEKMIHQRTRELELSHEQLRIQATHDPLTGMLNRAGILRVMEVEKERARRRGKTTLVALVDLDHFKRVNDDFGHLVGDEALRRFAAAITAAIRRYDHAGRFGGEEFLLVLSDVPMEAAEQRLARIHASISNLLTQCGESEIVLNCSIGGALFDAKTGPATNESLLSLADEALYAAKSAGRNCVVFRAPLQSYPGAEHLKNQSLST